MRDDLSQIAELWQRGGPFSGPDGKPHSRVTVQLPWSDLTGAHKYDILRTEAEAVGIMAWRGIPLRYFYKGDDSQEELEIPSIQTINWSRSIDQDAATCDITVYNTVMFDNDNSDGATITGQPGYYTPDRGRSPESQTRWGQEANTWSNLLAPNAIIRTYQGYGGNDKTIAQAVADGNIALTGVWLIDTVEIGTDATMSIHCRDTMKLLMDQQLYLPLVPRTKYPLTYYRWQWYNEDVRAHSRTVTTSTSTTVSVGDKHMTYSNSSEDMWYPQGSPGSEIPNGGYLLHGHRPIDALDGNLETFWLSVGNSRPDADFAYNFLEVNVNEGVNAVYVHPWAGNYTMFVSVMENGIWQGTETIPYDHSELIGTQPYWIDTGADIPYVASYGVPWERGQEYILPRAYNAQKVRITFHNLHYSDYGPWHYRAGVREFKVRVSQGGSTSSVITTNTQVLQPLFMTAGSVPGTIASPNAEGYVTSSTDFQFDAFGDARIYWPNELPWNSSHVVTALRITPTGLGYYVLDSGGNVVSYGDAVHQGQPTDDGYNPPPQGDWPYGIVFDMALTPSGDGYWILNTDGTVYAYGDATDYGNLAAPPAGQIYTSMDSHPDSDGYWVLQTDGTVTVKGASVNYGDFTPAAGGWDDNADPHSCVSLRSNTDGDGYWILKSNGAVQNFGAAVDYGQPTLINHSKSWADARWELLPTGSSDGYWILQGDGHVYAFGGANILGSPLPGTKAWLRRPGNYTDWSDIIKDLCFWSGFYVYDPDLVFGVTPPELLGVIESTGSYSDEDLPDDLFDKRPVIDPIHEIKESVGYVIGTTYYGGFFFRSPNWWKPGNFNQDLEHVDFVFEVDENTTLIDYHATVNDEPLRSSIIISSEDPGPFTPADDDEGRLKGTVTTRFIPATKRLLRGLVKPAMWVNGYFQNRKEQEAMAELIALHSWFQTRIGQVTCPFNPAIEPDDQVRIFERLSSDSYIHYVRGVSATHDLDSGSMTMTLTTHWMGDENTWALDDVGNISGRDLDTEETPLQQTFPISQNLRELVQKRLGSGTNIGAGMNEEVFTAKATGSQNGTGQAVTE